MEESIRFLLQAAHAASSADNSQPWRLVWDGDCLQVAYDEARVSGVTFAPDSHGILLTMGGLVENLVQAAGLLGLQPAVEWLEPSSNPLSYARVRDLCAARVPDGAQSAPLFGRHTNRLPYRQEPLPAEALSALEGLTEGFGRCQIYATAPETRAIAALVRTCSEVRFRTRELHEWLGHSFRFGREAARGDGLDVATLHLPPGGALFLRFVRDWRRMRALNRVGMYRLMAIIDAHPVAVAPALVAICGPRGHHQTLEAGRLLARTWIYLNHMGFAVHPYYVVTDQIVRRAEGRVPPALDDTVAEVEKELPAAFRLRPGETVHMLLRVGYPTRPARPSRRLPLEQVVSDVSN